MSENRYRCALGRSERLPSDATLGAWKKQHVRNLFQEYLYTALNISEVLVQKGNESIILTKETMLVGANKRHKTKIYSTTKFKTVPLEETITLCNHAFRLEEESSTEVR